MKIAHALLATALLYSIDASAGEFSFGASYWGYDISGQVDRAGDVLDFESDLAVRPRTQTQWLAAWNTGPGWAPDLALSLVPIRAKGDQEVSAGTRFGGLLFGSGNARVYGDARLDDLALALRYPLLKSDGAALWAGVTLKHVYGRVAVRDQNDTQEDVQEINQWFPMAHVAAALPLASWISFNGEANAIQYGGSGAWDLRVGASTRLLGPLGFNLGWQLRHYRVESGDYRLDATLSGLLAGLYLLLD